MRSPLPAHPTNALPRTEDKILVFMARARSRVELFHPDDARVPDLMSDSPEVYEDPDEAFRRFLERLNAAH